MANLRIYTILLLLALSALTGQATNRLVTELRPMGEEAMRRASSPDRKIREESLMTLMEVIIRCHDWIDTDNADEVKFIANAVATAITLKAETQRLDIEKEGKPLMVKLASITVNAPDNAFGVRPNVNPSLPSQRNINVERDLRQAVDAMTKSNLKKAENILIGLYDYTWLKGKERDHRHEVANKLILCHLQLGASGKALELARQNKIEMDRKGIIGSDYVENLVYMGFAYKADGDETSGRCYLEAAEAISRRLNLHPQEVMKDYQTVRKGSPVSDYKGKSEVIDFIRANDRNFWFLTERERSERWSLLSKRWDILKQQTANEALKSRRLDNLLNIFEYEKQLMLRSYTRISDTIRKSRNSEANKMFDRLRALRMSLASSFGAKWHEQKAEYEKIQKALMHHEVLDGFSGCLYNPLTVSEIASWLRPDETFIDFGIIKINGMEHYAAIIVNNDSPDGKLTIMCQRNELRSFLNRTADASASRMVRARYEDEAETLYRLLWKPLLETGSLRRSIYYSPVDMLNNIMPEAVRSHGLYLAENHNFHILTSFAAIETVRKGERYNLWDMVTYNAIEYLGDRSKLILDAHDYGCTRPIKKHILDVDKDMYHAFSKRENISPIRDEEIFDKLFDKAIRAAIGYHRISKESASEYSVKTLSQCFYDLVVISTHAFCLPRDVDATKYPYVMSQELNLENCEEGTHNLLPMFRTGLLLAGGQRAWCGHNVIDGIEDGVLNGEELSALDLSGIKLMCLIACSTGAGDIDETEGVFGLRRAVKLAGGRSMITTAWDINSEASEVYMDAFVDGLIAGEGISISHEKALRALMQRFNSPYYWAPFQLID